MTALNCENVVKMDDEKMKPLLIFQLSDRMSNEEKHMTANMIREGIRNGALVVDGKVTIISFDERGNMNFCSRRDLINGGDI